jgi:3-isopropylmalate/(R)-2-methylmalate dehydratase small subunit
MGHYLFYDVRFDDNKEPKTHPLNNLDRKDANILLVNKNFGCGSSREHAPQAIMRYGFKAIIGESFAEIFAGNCHQIGIPVVTISESDSHTIQALVDADASLPLHLDLEKYELLVGERCFSIDMPESRRESFLKGTWSVLELLKSNKAAIEAAHRRLPYSF